MDISCYIIKCDVRGQKNWSGKEFSQFPAKIYFDYHEVFTALDGYWFHNMDRQREPGDGRVIKIVPLTDKKKSQLLKQNAIRL